MSLSQRLYIVTFLLDNFFKYSGVFIWKQLVTCTLNICLIIYCIEYFLSTIFGRVAYFHANQTIANTTSDKLRGDWSVFYEIHSEMLQRFDDSEVRLLHLRPTQENFPNSSKFSRLRGRLPWDGPD